MGDWVRAAEKIVRHVNGTFYLRVKVGGKIIRESLKTKNLKVAKERRDERVASLRKMVRNPERLKAGAIRTLGDALAVLRVELTDRPHVRPKTRQYGAAVARIMEDSLPLETMAKRWSQRDAVAWWGGIVKRFSPSVVNHVLPAAQRLGEILIEAGISVDSPTKTLRRVPVKKVFRKMPSKDEMDAVVNHIRMQRKRACVESSHMVAFFAFSGLRAGELRNMKWEDVREHWLTVGADGNTKSKRFRPVPISTPLRMVLEDMMKDGATGPLFGIASPRRALGTACEALGLPPMRIHDLRHFFATWCIERGIDMPTLAKWLGHADGGALAMRTYGHVRDDHSLEMVKRLE